MKKTYCGIILAALFIVMHSNYQKKQNKGNLSDLALANIEALTSDENTDIEHCERLCQEWQNVICVLETSSRHIICLDKYPK